MNNIMYRSEDSYGSGVRDILDVMVYEIYELGNVDILEYVCDNYLDEDKKGTVEKVISSIENEQDDLTEEWVQEVCRSIINEINKKTKHDLKYALWLADKNVVEDMYTDDPLNIDAYYTSDVILSDLGNDGILFAYGDYPEPIN